MLLKMRSLPPKANPRPDNGILKAVDGSDEHAARWFDMIKITREFPLIQKSAIALLIVSIALFLEERQATMFDPSDSRSLDLHYGAKLLPLPNVYQ